MNKPQAIAVLAVFCGLAPPALGDPYVACDNGLRCIMAPCPSTNAVNLQSGQTGRVTGVDLERLSPRDRDKVADTNAIHEGRLVIEGDIRNRRVRQRKTMRPAAVLVARGVERRSTSRERRMCRSGQ